MKRNCGVNWRDKSSILICDPTFLVSGARKPHLRMTVHHYSVLLHLSPGDLDMSQRCTGSPSLSCPITYKPAGFGRRHHSSRPAWSFPSPRKCKGISSAASKRTLFTHEEARTTQRLQFRQLCDLDAASLLFERRRDAAKVRLAQAAIMDTYTFPDYRLKKKMDDPSKTPLLLVACGSFSPITFLHLRMFIMAGDYVKFSTDFEIVGGYLSPVSDAYKKAGLASAEHR
jgi:hypothetical protein